MTETGRATLDKAPAGLHEQVPYLFGSAMVGIGLVTLGLASLESRSSAKALDLAYPVSKGFPTAPRTFAQALAALIGVLGIGVLAVMNLGR